MSRKTAWCLAAIVLLALALRLWLLGRMGPPAPSPDAENYAAMARQLLDRGVYGYMSEQPNAYVTPGYPLFLTAIFALGGTEGTVRIIQAVLGALTLVPLALIARDAAGDRAAVVTALILALYPAWLRAPAYLLTEVLFTFTFSLFLWVQVRAVARGTARWALLAGLTLGLAVLVRPVLAPLLPLPWLYRMWEERSIHPWRPALWALAGFALAMLPWWVRNLAVLGKPILFATQTGNPILGGMDPYDLWQGKLWSGVGSDTGDQLRRAGEIFAWLLREHPWLTLRWFTVGKFSRIFLNPWLAWEFPTLVHLHSPVVTFGWAGALAGLRHRAVRPLSLVLILLTIIQLAFIPESRYAYPLIGLLAITGSLALVRIFSGGERHGTGADHHSSL
jgi:4-amino-4-deoxy-L-arabinose transferase-like glycosyltransferase